MSRQIILDGRGFCFGALFRDGAERGRVGSPANEAWPGLEESFPSPFPTQATAARSCVEPWGVDGIAIEHGKQGQGNQVAQTVEKASFPPDNRRGQSRAGGPQDVRRHCGE